MWALPPDAALHRVEDPEAAAWGLPEQLLATVADYAALQTWIAAGGKRSDKPRPIPRPGITQPADDSVYGRGEGLPLAEMDEWLGLTG